MEAKMQRKVAELLFLSYIVDLISVKSLDIIIPPKWIEYFTYQKKKDIGLFSV